MKCFCFIIHSSSKEPIENGKPKKISLSGFSAAEVIIIYTFIIGNEIENDWPFYVNCLVKTNISKYINEDL